MEEIDKLREGEQQNYEAARRAIQDSASLVEDLLALYKLLADLVRESGVAPRDEVVAGSQFLLACRYQLTTGALTALRGHLNDSFCFSRKAIEFCAFAARVKKHPHLAMVWLVAWRDQPAYERFREKFAPGKLFPEDHILLGKLYDRYDHCSKMIHPSVYSLGGHIEVVSEAPVFELKFDYFQLKDADPSEPIRTLLWIVDTHFGILRVFEEIFDSVIAHDPARWRIERDAVNAKIVMHKVKWRPVLIQAVSESEGGRS